MPRTPPRNRPIPNPPPNRTQVPNPLIPGESSWVATTPTPTDNPPRVATPPAFVPPAPETLDRWRMALNGQYNPAGNLTGEAYNEWISSLPEVDFVRWEACRTWEEQRAFLGAFLRLPRATNPAKITEFATKTGAVFSTGPTTGGNAPPISSGVIVVYGAHIIVGLEGCTHYSQIDWAISHRTMVPVADDLTQAAEGTTTRLGNWWPICIANAKEWKTRIAAVKATYPAKKVIIVGHSLGAATMCLLMADDMVRNGSDGRYVPGDIVQGLGFGCPRVYGSSGPTSLPWLMHATCYNNHLDPFSQIPVMAGLDIPRWYRNGVGTVPYATQLANEREDYWKEGAAQGPDYVFPSSLQEFYQRVDQWHSMNSYYEGPQLLLNQLRRRNAKWDAFYSFLAGLPVSSFTNKPGGW